jgi:hypothetical protein
MLSRHSSTYRVSDNTMRNNSVSDKAAAEKGDANEAQLRECVCFVLGLSAD